MSYRDRKRKPIAEINVVPYIDVMLVLLIIFMVTAPLLTEGVKVDLPQTKAEPVEFNPDSPEPVIITVDESGKLFIDKDESTPEQVAIYARAALKARPNTDFLVRADKTTMYNDVVTAMVLLKEAGVETVNLVTQPVSE